MTDVDVKALLREVREAAAYATGSKGLTRQQKAELLHSAKSSAVPEDAERQDLLSATYESASEIYSLSRR